jgi:hypothetical protein
MLGEPGSEPRPAALRGGSLMYATEKRFMNSWYRGVDKVCHMGYTACM